MAIEIVSFSYFFQYKWWFSMAMLIYQRVDVLLDHLIHQIFSSSLHQDQPAIGTYHVSEHSLSK